jgi:hypothetical protein
MKPVRLLTLGCLLLSATLFAQKDVTLPLRNGAITPTANIRTSYLDSFQKALPQFKGKSFIVIQFEQLPTDADRKLMSGSGIELLEYLPPNAYTATISAKLDAALLQWVRARAVVSLSPRQKMDAYLGKGFTPAWAVKQPGTIDVLVSFPKTFSSVDVLADLPYHGAQVLDRSFQSLRILKLRVESNKLEELAALPYVEYLQSAPPGDQPLNFDSRSGARANLLNAPVAAGGKALNGEGVVVGVGDNADLQGHVDFSGRLISRAGTIFGAHGTHVAGTVGGAGTINELYKGFAPRSTIISQVYNRIIANAAAYVQDHGMVITNNSYGDIIECDYYGSYDLISRALDQMAFDLPQLSNVFAAGNSGGDICPPYTAGFRTVLGGYQTAKNVITVGATTDSGVVAAFSSRGPVRDGRLKPEIAAMGQFVPSTWPVNIYSYNNGTSMAAPAVSGGLALLYQRYRQLNGGANPKNVLMKALLCNGALDKGNAGPDYQYGFGWMNLLRSVEMLENNLYFNNTVAQNATTTHTITVPPNTAQLKVMLCWNDPAASPLSSRMLVNDLDLQVVAPGAVSHLPRILDTAVANVGNVATTGTDKLNNVEQIVINNPTAGTYTIRVNGVGISQNSQQEYVVVYDAVPVQLKITSPAGGEGWAPSTNAFDMMKIGWEVYGIPSGPATIEFSQDGGATWTTLSSSVNIASGLFSWFVPNVATDRARVRITRNGSGETATSDLFTIAPLPVVSLAPVQCERYIALNWTSITGVTDFEVMMLRGAEMQTVATTTGNSYTFSGLSKDSVYWVTVRPRVNGKGGRRANAVQRQPNNGTCAGAISDGDLAMDAILSPASGRKFTSTQLSNTTTISVRIRNLDDVPLSNFDVSYAVNGSAWVTENVTTAIPANGTYVHNFAAPVDLSAVGSYTISAVVKRIGDGVAANDSATKMVKHVDNAPLTLSTYFTDNLETAQASEYRNDTIGLNGIERYDFSETTPLGRVRTFVNSGIAYSGSKALTLDAQQSTNSGNTNYLYGTFNLATLNAAASDVRLDFRYLNHGQEGNAADKVWVRGNDTQPWVEVYNLEANEEDPGIYKKTESIEVSDALVAAGQSFSSSFQVRWGQWGRLPAGDRETGSGYTFDDIRLYTVQNDLQLRALEAPMTVSCALSSASTIRIAVRNSANAPIANVPVRYRINGGAWVSEVIPSVAGNTTVSYSFTTAANLSALGSFTIQTLVDLPGDSFRDNDTLTSVVRNQPVIASFPYLQNFENSDGFWFAEGKNSTWEWGVPSSARISKAASGSKAWKTRLRGHYNDREASYLYSPCFDVTGLAKPTLSFSVALDIEDCGSTLCDAAWVEYSSDGLTWTKLDTSGGNGINWYNKTGPKVWSTQNYFYWHVATASLPTGLNRLRLRFVFASDEGVTREGIAVDDIHIYDNTRGIYDGGTMTSTVTQTVSGNNWVDFTSSGKLVASVQPSNQAMGSTAVQAYVFNGAVRNNGSQYYHHRNLTIKPVAAINDSVVVRFYFLDIETDTLLRATGCSTCTRPGSAYELGVSQYSDPDKNFENGTIADNQQGLWQFIAGQRLAIVPFDKGYYAEFKVKDFSEFWLNNGGMDKSTPLPVKMMEFTAQKAGNDVVLNWKVASETNVVRYEIELARGNAAAQSGQYQKIGEVASAGNSTGVRNYSFTDTEADKFGPRYYRLKIINSDGSFLYSPVRVVVFEEAKLWQVYPNPSAGEFFMQYQINAGVSMNASVYDSKGRLVKTLQAAGSGQPQKIAINLKALAAGVYLLQVQAGEVKRDFKLFKQ